MPTTRPSSAGFPLLVLWWIACVDGSAIGLTVRPRVQLTRASVSCAERLESAERVSHEVFNANGDLAAVRVSGSLSVEAGTVLPVGDKNGIVLYQRNEFSYLLLTPESVPTLPGSSTFGIPPCELAAGLTLNWKGQRVAGPALVVTGTPAREAFAGPIEQKKRASPRAGLLTGLTAIDALAPLGRGQSMLVIGPEDSTASDLCLDVINAQRDSGIRTIYVAMRPAEEMAAIAERTCCVAMSSSTEGEFAASVAVACSLGEEIRDGGKHACVVIDDLQPLRTLWNFMQDTERKMYAEEGVGAPLDVEMVAVRDDATGSELRTFYANLLERAAVRSAIAGGGSQTLLLIARKPSMYAEGADSIPHPLSAFDPALYPKSTLERLNRLSSGGVQLTAAVLAKLGISSPGSQGSDGMLAARTHIDECISLADGHLQLDERLVRAGVVPAIDVRESLSRIGLGKAVSLRSTPMAAAIRQVAPRLRLELAVASDMPTAGVMGEGDPRVFGWRAVLQQQPGKPRSLQQSVLALFCARAGYFDSLTADGLDVASEKAYALVDAIIAACPAIVGRMHVDYELTPEDESALHGAVASIQSA
jgi:F-type H+-transporting ATPase subunit alpha